MQKMPVILLMGQTATGKTQLAIDLAKRLPLEVINTDSALVYRCMDIGTAIPTLDERSGVPHHLIDICEPSEPYSAGQFCEDALRLIPEIHDRGHIPCLTGGTMLYFHYLESGYLGQPRSDPQIRASIEEKGSRMGWPKLWEALKTINPKRASEIHPNDKQRIARSLEVAEIKRTSAERPADGCQKLTDSYPVYRLALYARDRQILHDRIQRRFHAMLDKGFLDEVKTLMQAPTYCADLPSMKTVGYRQAVEYLNGNSCKDTFIEKAIAATRQLAKRQHTWLKKWDDSLCVDFQTPDLVTFCAKLLQEQGLSAAHFT